MPSPRYAIVVGRWNEAVNQRLLDGAVSALLEAGTADDQIEIVWTPGSWEIPVAARAFAKSGRVSAVICLGTILKGETPHGAELATTVAGVLADLAVDTGTPITWGIIHCDTMDQALARAGGETGNRGTQAALAAVEMVSLLQRIG